MQNSQRPKHHHYVPRNHLRRFTSAAGKLHVFDKSTGNKFQSGVEGVAGEQNFNVVPSIEAVLAKVDGKFKNSVDNLLAKLENGAFGPEDRNSIAPFLAIQILRTRETREMVDQLGIDLIYREAELRGRPITTPRDRVSIHPNILALQHLVILFDPVRSMELAQFLCNDYVWLVGVNHTSNPLWASDAPMVIKSHSDKAKGFRERMLLSGAERQFALCPKYVLILLMRRFAKSLEAKEGSIFPLTAEQVAEHNLLQISQCTNQVYSPDEDFTIAEKFRQDYPDACHPKRRRFKIG